MTNTKQNQVIISGLVIVLAISLIAATTATSEASSKYKAKVDLTTSGDCWEKATVRLTTGVEGTGKLLAKFVKTINPESDSSSDLYLTKTLSFDGSKVKGEYIFLTIRFDTGKHFYLDADFIKSKKTYSFQDRLNMQCRGDEY